MPNPESLSQKMRLFGRIKKMGSPRYRSIAATFLIIALFSLLVSLLLSGISVVTAPRYSAGDIARADIVVPADIAIHDERATEARKETARANVLPVYGYDPSLKHDLPSRISQSFAACRKLLETETIRNRVPPYGRLSASLKTALDSVLSVLPQKPGENLMEVLVSQRFNEDLANNLAGVLGQVLDTYTVESEKSLTTVQGNIAVVDGVTKKEEPVPAVQVFTAAQVRQRARELLTEKLDGIPGTPVIGDWLAAMARPNLRFDLPTTEARKQEAVDRVDPVLRQLKKGKVIVRRGDEIDPDQLLQIEAIQQQTPEVRSRSQLIGLYLLTATLLSLLALLLRPATARQWNPGRLLVLSLTNLAVNLVVLKVFWFVYQSLSRNLVASPFDDSAFFFYALPFAFGGMLAMLLAGSRVAQLFLIFYCPLAGYAVGAGFQDFLYIVILSLAGIIAVAKARQRVAIVISGFKVSVAGVLLFFVVQLAKQNQLDWTIAIFGACLSFLSGPITASLLTFALPLYERLFRVTTEIRLSELSNLNLPLVRELVLKAPGTYNHSIAVGTLAESAAKSIGLNPLFVRVACLYHDIGKSLQPDFFIENQAGQPNPHDRVSPHESVKIIREHVSGGIRMARAARLPQSIIDIIPQHHGTKVLRFFHEKAKRLAQADGPDIREEDFRYPGPKPQSKEAAVIMLADAVEAAARTLTDHSQERHLELIRKIVSSTTEDGQFSDCDITLAEIEHITFSMLETLSSIYHSRIAYPGFDFRQKDAPAHAAS